MSLSDLELLADGVLRYLRDEGAVRIDEDTVGDYRTVFQICDALRIDPTTWRQIKKLLNKWGEEEGYSVVYIQNRGHYIGWAGEEITNDVAKYRIAQGWVKTLEASKDRIENSSRKQKYWIEKRYKDFKLGEEEKANVETTIRA